MVHPRVGGKPPSAWKRRSDVADVSWLQQSRSRTPFKGSAARAASTTCESDLQSASGLERRDGAHMFLRDRTVDSEAASTTVSVSDLQ